MSLLVRVVCPPPCVGEFEYYVVRPGSVPVERALLQNGKIRVMLKPKRHSSGWKSKGVPPRN